MNISYDWYKIFYHVAKCGNFTMASEHLFISQPAVSQSIKQLETSLGCTLFIRTSKGVKLTAEGETLFQYISKGIEQIKLGEKRLKAQLSLESGEIYIGASDMTLEYYLLPYLERFHKMYPKIRIIITNGPTPETLAKLKNNIIDFGVISEPIGELNSSYLITPVKKIEDIFITGTEKKEYETLTLNQLKETPLIMLEEGTSTRKYIDDFLNNNDVSVLPEFELATSSLIVQFTKRNLGVGCVVRDFAQEALKEGSVIEVKLDKQIPKRNICLIRKKDVVSNASEKLLSLLLS